MIESRSGGQGCRRMSSGFQPLQLDDKLSVLSVGAEEVIQAILVDEVGVHNQAVIHRLDGFEEITGFRVQVQRVQLNFLAFDLVEPMKCHDLPPCPAYS